MKSLDDLIKDLVVPEVKVKIKDMDMLIIWIEAGINLIKIEIDDSLIFNEITNIILSGGAKIVKKNTLEQSLDENDNVIGIITERDILNAVKRY